MVKPFPSLAPAGFGAAASLGALLALSGIFGSAHAQFLWQTTHTSNGGYNQGQAPMARNEVFVTVHPGYLDVEEEVEISTSGTVNAGNDPNTLEITGAFSLPPEATVVGVLLWNGQTVLEGKLLSKSKADSLYQAQVERNSTPPPRPRDPILISMTGPGTYQFSVYPVKIDESRRLRLRYHLPAQLGPAGMTIPLKTAFANLTGETKVQVHLVSAQGETNAVDTVTWVQEGMLRRLDLPRNLFVTGNQLQGTLAQFDWWGNLVKAATPGIEVRPKDPLYQAMYTTSLPAGQMEGHYLHLYSGVPDAALQTAGMRMEIAVYWKWHHPGNWTVSYASGAAPDFNYALVSQAEQQARQIEQLYRMVQPQGATIGLVHADGRNVAKSFALSAPGQPAYRQALEYLAQWNGPSLQDFITRSQGVANGKQGAVQKSIAGEDSSFKAEIRLVRSLYSQDGKSVRHLILISCGPVADLEGMPNLNAVFDKEFQGLPLTLGQASGSTFAYPGFDLWTAKKAHPLPDNRYPDPRFELPILPNFAATATLRNEKNAYDLDLSCQGGLGVSCGQVIWHGKSGTAWQPRIEWQLHDAGGLALPPHVQTLQPVATAKDTGLAVLWAGSASPFSENREPPLGPVYGFVDRFASLLALEKDSLRTTAGEVLPSGSVPRIANADILAVLPNYNPNTPPEKGGGIPGGTVSLADRRHAALRATPAWQVQIASGRLTLRIPGFAGAGLRARIRLVGIDGRVVGSWDQSPASDGLMHMTLPAGMAGLGGLHWLKVEAEGVTAAKRILLP